ncbi:MAG: DEAD/DEAH box helicase, partial [Gemmatimonadetes bacterium]|nr:DEAD/DEAH box helicase [Gemmatimonadota bacterium]
GFYPDMRDIASYLPAERDGFMFSATYPPAVLSLSRQFLSDPEFLSLSRGHEHVAETEHVYFVVPKMEKDRGLVRIIELENPDSAIIFCNTKANARYVSIVLKRFGYDAEQLSADLSQSARERVLQRMYQRTLRFLVATDLAGRGIDIDELSHVILYDFPEDPESYIHRAGRTGRAGAAGTAISLVDVLERLELKNVGKKYNIELTRREMPTDKDVQEVVSQRVTALLEQKLRGLDRLVVERMERMMPLARSLGDSDDERRVIAMLLDQFYQQSLHAAPELPEQDKKADKPRAQAEEADAGDDGESEAGEAGEGGSEGASHGRRGRRRRRGGRR